MISRLSLAAAAFACIVTTTIAWAANAQHPDTRVDARATRAETAVEAMPIVRLETVTVVGRRATR